VRKVSKDEELAVWTAWYEETAVLAQSQENSEKFI